MKTKKMISSMLASLLVMVLCFTTGTINAQNNKESAMMKDCCMMKEGKMMCIKAGKTMPMDIDMTMKNGTKCMTNGECIMKDGKKMKMKDGDCIDMNGKIEKCDMMNKGKGTTEDKNKEKSPATTYTCSMHPEVTSDNPGKCPKCGMDLIEKK